jgi:large subunit ribosomal protein L13e
LSQAGDSTLEELANATQVQGDNLSIACGEKCSVQVMKVTEEIKGVQGLWQAVVERMN